MDFSMPRFAVPHQLLEFAQVLVHSIEKMKVCDIWAKIIPSLLSQLSNNETPFQIAVAKKQNIPFFPAPS